MFWALPYCHPLSRADCLHSFQFLQPLAQLFPLLLSDLLTLYKMQILKLLVILEQEKKFLPKVTSFFPGCYSGLFLPQHTCPGALQPRDSSGAVDPCAFRPYGPHSDFVFSCSSFRASPYGRSSLTSPISEVTETSGILYQPGRLPESPQLSGLPLGAPCSVWRRARPSGTKDSRGKCSFVPCLPPSPSTSFVLGFSLEVGVPSSSLDC